MALRSQNDGDPDADSHVKIDSVDYYWLCDDGVQALCQLLSGVERIGGSIAAFGAAYQTTLESQLAAEVVTA